MARKLIYTFESIISLPIDQVSAKLFEIVPGKFSSDRLPFILKGKPNCEVMVEDIRHKITFADVHKEYITIDRANQRLIVEGEW